MTFNQSKLASAVVAVIIAFTNSACGNGDSKQAVTNLAARVDSEEISILQVQQVLKRNKTAGSTPQTLQAVSRDALERLIDQQLAASQAEKRDLHRTPEVAAQLDVARREIMARAYLQQLNNALPKPSEEQIAKYYADNPQLFSARRIYDLQEIVVSIAPGISDKLKTFAGTGKSIEDAAAWLKEGGIEFRAESATQAAEQIPLVLLGKVGELKNGQTVVIESPKVTTLLRVNSSQAAPIQKAVARSRIEQYLINQASGKTVAENLKKLRADSKISYFADFAKGTETTLSTTTLSSPIGNARQTNTIEPTKRLNSSIE